MDSQNSFGGRLTEKATDHISRGIALTTERLGPHKKRVALSIMDELFRVMDAEAGAALGPWLQRLLNTGQVPDSLRPLLTVIAKPDGQWTMFAAGSATGAVMAGGLGALLTNELGPAIADVVETNPNIPISVSDIANAAVRDIPVQYPHEREARRQGIRGTRFNALVELNKARPTPDVIATLYNRGVITRERAEFLLRRNGYDDADREAILALRHAIPTPAELAEMTVRGIIPQGDARALAVQSGVSHEDFDRLALLAGEPPAIQELLFAWRRGFISEARLRHGIEQSRVRNEWIDVVEKSGTVPMSTSDAITAAVKGHLTPDAARTIAHQNGLIPDQFDTLLATAGNPPGVQEMLSWWRRGLMTEEQVVQGIRESHLNNKYIPLIKAASEALPPLTSIRAMVRHGTITVQRGLDLLAKHGYAPDIAAALLNAASAAKTQTQRDLSVSQVLTLHTDRALSDVDATAILTGFGYDESEIGWLLLLSTFQRLRRFEQAALNRISRSYVTGVIDVTQASGALDGLQVTPDARDDLIALWDEERATPTKSLTSAQVAQAVVRGYLTHEEGVSRLIGQGYAADDADIVLNLALPKPKPPKVRPGT